MSKLAKSVLCRHDAWYNESYEAGKILGRYLAHMYCQWGVEHPGQIVDAAEKLTDDASLDDIERLVDRAYYADHGGSVVALQAESWKSVHYSAFQDGGAASFVETVRKVAGKIEKHEAA